MPSKQHGRQYDVVVFGATGYTGKYTAQHIATHLPTDLKWAVAGRSHNKLEQVVAQCKELNPDRSQPEIEICNLTDADLDKLAKKTFILITTVGPYGLMGEHAFKACAQNGTHYLDVTGEVPFVARMIRKYQSAAQASGAVMLPQIGIESAPTDLLTWSLAKRLRSDSSSSPGGAKTADVTVSIHKLKSAPSGGTLTTVLTVLENFTLTELRDSHKPYALSPVPRSSAPATKKAEATCGGTLSSILTRVTGLVTFPVLGLLTSSVAARTDAAIVERTWGLLEQARQQQQQTKDGDKDEDKEDKTYGPNFSFREFMKPRNWLTGIGIHLGIMLMGLVLVTPLLRNLVRKVVYQAGEGADYEQAKKDEIEYRGIARPDVATESGRKHVAYGRAWFNGAIYYLTGVLLAEAAATLLEEGLDKPFGNAGGIYTPACLGQPFIDRLDRAGFHFETQMIDV